MAYYDEEEGIFGQRKQPKSPALELSEISGKETIICFSHIKIL
jgi:hypothetical protein